MKSLVTLLLFLTTLALYSQANTEVFLFDLEANSSKIEIKNAKNLSNNEGYDNQPSFLNDRYILFASTRNGQTDIAKYDMRYDSKSWLNFTEGGEYTPLKIPNKNEVSAVRLDKDGKQRLYAYNMSNGDSNELIQDLVVAYYTWYDEQTIVSAVIEEDNLNLYTTNLEEGKSRKYQLNVGRSFHKIPNSNLVSYISKDNENQWQIKSLNPISGATKVIANTMTGVEDICWLDSKTILSGKDSVLYKLTLQKDNNWKKVADLTANGITKITRLAVNPEGTKLLIAGDITNTTVTDTKTTEETTQTQTNESEESTTESNTATSKVEAIVQRNLEAYNARDIDAFMADYADDIKLYNYPNTLSTEGKEAMRKGYKDWFDRVPDLRAYIKKRIVIGNKVIDEEQVTANGQVFNAVAIYEVENGKIVKVTFIQ
ncbi:nuclear transport factor 2 family protein [Psychroserpens luteolus]|uniref:nuclear transport factor 2 family protein n=1 Tax=Psychroserpens luteolus TaxID=2855840 RepID=UPI001E3AF7FE|nr:nuclear transport factor 2 family protein [Psychroserpens luteolus]MCD2259902.1 nuclear transport factor 2 family protein [Psychroserpens luteolus]